MLGLDREVTRDDIEPVFPDYGSMHMDDIRADLRDRAISSTYFMARAVIGFKDLTRPTHGPICKIIESPSTRKLIVVPRDHLKTSICTIADTTRRVAQNPSIRILIGNETATNSSHFLRRIEAIFDRCSMFRWLFPDLLEDPSKRQKWSETEMLVPRKEDHPESTVEAIGVGGAVVSRHYDVIKLDDIVGKEASESEEVMRKTIDWYIYCESLLVHPTQSEIHVIGTRWAYHDVIQKILTDELEVYDKLVLSALDGQNGLWPERFPLHVLDIIRQKMGSWKFSCQYLNAPHDPEASSFNPNWLRYYTMSGGSAAGGFSQTVCQSEAMSSNVAEMRRFLIVDPAISDNDQACNTAMVVVGHDILGRKWVLETFARRIQPIELIRIAFLMYQRWDCELLGVESVSFQKALKYFMQQEMERLGIYINVVELKPDNRKSKKTRIRGLQPFFENGEIFLKREMEQLIDEYSAFPTGQLVDLLDALSYGPYVWGPPSSAADDDLEDDLRVSASIYQGMNPTTGY
jgi:predicted phage terminase large subunit-like protein